MEPILELEQVTKKYGRKKALDRVTLRLDKGKIIGLLGSNGSGKTTLLKLAAGIAFPTSGKVRIGGIDAGLQTKSLVSFLPDQSVLESWMRVKDAVRYYRDFYPDFKEEKAQSMLEFMKLQPNDRVTALSKGMRERLEVVLVLSRSARLYLLDEPIGGVDPVARGKILDAIVQFFDEDSTLVVCTHLVSDMERVFDEVVFIREGEMILQEEVESIRVNRGLSIDGLYKEVYGE
ncbi:ABC transporter ATP-binding protein [Paenibacillus protaetiae]|uniref:ABC transporter ATP-binding protein n=1 Tax=Paenibacillus protaetiae TaxID=2509456 RepID=A0A4P6ERR4_9BACL|nr:ABC transporter ATP-binding protein [Paenibacillus protaetiae]QAY65226.1 ABC transporter ATP-binding protein [Paenibacillus protaetiae]